MFALAFLLSSCMTGYTDKSKGIATFNVIGGDASRIVSTPDGIIVDGLVTSKAFAALGKAVVSVAGITSLASGTKNADKLAAQESTARTAAGVSKANTAAGVATNASNNATAIKLLETKGKTAIGILKNTPTP